MAELSLNLPVVGEKDTSAEPKVTTALSEIQTQINGKIAAVNLEANAVETAKIKAEAVTGPKLGAETLRILVATKYEALKSLTGPEMETGFEASATRPALVLFKAGSAGTPTVGGVAIINTGGPATILLPPGQKLKATVATELSVILL